MNAKVIKIDRVIAIIGATIMATLTEYHSLSHWHSVAPLRHAEISTHGGYYTFKEIPL